MTEALVEAVPWVEATGSGQFLPRDGRFGRERPEDHVLLPGRGDDLERVRHAVPDRDGAGRRRSGHAERGRTLARQAALNGFPEALSF